jgi:hypothetical protein
MDKKITKWTIRCLLLVSVVTVASWLLYRWANQPAQSAVESKIIEQTTQPTALPAIPLETDYFSTNLPSSFSVRTITKKDGAPQLLQISTLNDRSYSQLAFTIGRFSSESLASIADYNYRNSNRDVYQEVQYDWLPKGAVAFINLTGNEITVFAPNSNLYAIVTISASDISQESATQNLKAVVSGWHWK